MENLLRKQSGHKSRLLHWIYNLISQMEWNLQEVLIYLPIIPFIFIFIVFFFFILFRTFLINKCWSIASSFQRRWRLSSLHFKLIFNLKISSNYLMAYKNLWSLTAPQKWNISVKYKIFKTVTMNIDWVVNKNVVLFNVHHFQLLHNLNKQNKNSINQIVLNIV